MEMSEFKVYASVVMRTLVKLFDGLLHLIGLQRTSTASSYRRPVVMYFTLSEFRQDIKRERANRAIRTLVSN